MSATEHRNTGPLVLIWDEIVFAHAEWSNQTPARRAMDYARDPWDRLPQREISLGMSVDCYGDPYLMHKSDVKFKF